MQTTAKSLQLIDANGINISPTTDLTSLYYEVERKYNDTSIIARKYVYSGFPVAVNIDPSISTNIGSIAWSTYSVNPYSDYKLVDKDTNEDIIVSNISTSIIPGTTYRQLNVKNYNLSEILTHYTTRDLFNASINDINAHISGLDSSINKLYDALNTSVGTLEQILNAKPFIPNKFYLITDYYKPSQPTDTNGCMAMPGSNFSGPSSNNSLSLLIKANDTSTFNGKLYNMYDHNGNSLNVYGTYDIIKNDIKSEIKITLLKDNNGNEAPYDFYNLIYKQYSYYNYTFTNKNGKNAVLQSEEGTIKNNIIKSNPFIKNERDNNYKMLTFRSNYGELVMTNNYIGYNNFIYIDTNHDESKIKIENNFIGNNNWIEYNHEDPISHGDNTGLWTLLNSRIYNNNIISIWESLVGFEFDNLIIGSSNNIKIKPGPGCITTMANLIVNSENNLNLRCTNNNNNITILNNCNASINLADNIMVDEYNSNPSEVFNASSNCAYMFGYNVYAKSFNTLR